MRARAREIVAGLTRAEKIRLLSGRDMWHLEPVLSAGIAAVRMADGPHGVRKQKGTPDTVGMTPAVPATCFPPPVTLASSWDVDLAEEVGRAVGAEARAHGVGLVLGPGLNLKRHPCCGRNFEYFSEDPLLSGKMAAAVVRGIQSTGVGACLKHFAANNQESGRMVVDVIVDERTLRELYLRGFEIAVRESRPWAVMCAYNRVNGVYCSDSRWLLTEVLREEWGFGGLVMSDWGATNDRVAGVTAGLDLEMPSSGGAFDDAIETAVIVGELAESAVDRAAERVVTLALRAIAGAGHDAPPFDPDAHHALARRAAAEGAVLLANDGTLPLRAEGRIALIGAFAEQPRYQGAGSSQVEPTRLDTALDAMRKRAGGAAEISYASGYDPVTGDTDSTSLGAAVAAAGAADVAVVMIGLPAPIESEGFDRHHLRMPAGHERLTEAVCDANPRTVVVLSNGAPVEMAWAQRPAAILESYLGGQAGGSAVVDVLFGDREPGGRLAETFPLVQSDIPADACFPGDPRQVEYRECLWVGYRHFQTARAPVLFPFGHGLSYTTFEYGELRLPAGRIGPDEMVSVRVPVKNTGTRRGSTVVQVYVRDLASALPRPEFELAAFAKVRLGPGESDEVTLEIDPRSFGGYDAHAHGWRVGGGAFEVLVGASAADIRTRARITIGPGPGPGPTDAPQPAGNHEPHVAGDSEFAALLGRPVPEPDPVRPFSRLTTVAELGSSRFGRLVQRRLVAVARSEAGPASDPATGAMLERVVMEMPLRNLVTMSGGRVSWRMLDALVHAVNGHPARAIRRLLHR